ncbi:Glycosyltransferase [Desulfovibrio sp. DV]|uniref:glycosyltransferase family 4 protein n=1 Tax=Desulfovibrio sp. DV TaxID=1844708 RepID=UPI00094BA41A|nr:glycosyltransferase family 4 protein [Desulfovibrio sp. DV]OLN28942.1 Glycosyltransferase [Desulfovibrio sp. DV]
MRILLCCADWGVPLGGCAGSSVHVRAMARALSGLGHEVRLVVSNADGPNLPPLPVTVVPGRAWWPAVRDGVERCRGRVARDVSPAATRVEAGSAAPGGAWQDFCPGSEKADVPSLKTRLYYEHLPMWFDRVEELAWHRRRFERVVGKALDEFRPHAVYERYALGQTGAARALERFGPGAPPFLLEVNASLADERASRGDLPGLFGRLARWQEVRQWRRADTVFCVSRTLGERLERSGVDPGRIEVTPNGVDVDRFSPDRPRGTLRSRLQAEADDVLVGFVGSLSPGRGAVEFLEIMAKTLPMAPRALGVVVGGGPLADALRRRAGELGLHRRVVFLGPVAHEAVPDLLVDLDIALACYPAQEAFYFSPMKVLEYMAAGLAVVCGRVGQMRELVADGVSGLLVEPGNPEVWAAVVAGLCRDSRRRAALGAQARSSALAGPTWGKNAARVVAAIEGVTARRGGRYRP